MAKAPLAARIVPSLEKYWHLPWRDFTQLRASTPRTRADQLAAIGSRYFDILAGFITSVPSFIRIETEIFDSYPMHRREQSDFLCNLRARLKQPGDSHRRLSGLHLHDAVAAYSSTLRDLCDHLGNGERTVRAQPFGNWFLQCTDDRLGTFGYAGDIAITDTWARQFDLLGWYEWRPIDITMRPAPAPSLCTSSHI